MNVGTVEKCPPNIVRLVRSKTKDLNTMLPLHGLSLETLNEAYQLRVGESDGHNILGNAVNIRGARYIVVEKLLLITKVVPLWNEPRILGGGNWRSIPVSI